jgi:hypothetical protein
MSCGPQNSAWVSSYGQELLEREDGHKGRLCQVAQGQQGSEEGGPGLRAEAGRNGQEAFQRGILPWMIL